MDSARQINQKLYLLNYNETEDTTTSLEQDNIDIKINNLTDKLNNLSIDSNTSIENNISIDKLSLSDDKILIIFEILILNTKQIDYETISTMRSVSYNIYNHFNIESFKYGYLKKINVINQFNCTPSYQTPLELNKAFKESSYLSSQLINSMDLWAKVYKLGILYEKIQSNDDYIEQYTIPPQTLLNLYKSEKKYANVFFTEFQNLIKEQLCYDEDQLDKSDKLPYSKSLSSLRNSLYAKDLFCWNTLSLFQDPIMNNFEELKKLPSIIELLTIIESKIDFITLITHEISLDYPGIASPDLESLYNEIINDLDSEINEELLKKTESSIRLKFGLYEDFFSLLTNLTLLGSQLYRIPKELDHLYNLSSLTIDSCSIKDFSDDTFSPLQNLEKLTLTDLRLESIPKSVFDLYELKKLDVSRNLIEEIPSDILRLKNLKKLNIYNNFLNEIPSYIFECNNLKCIDACTNYISILPSNIPSTSQIKKLYLPNNLLENIDAILENLSELIQLDVSKNIFLETLSNNPWATTQLKILKINKCSIERLPQSISSSISLEELYLSKNRLKTLPSGISALSKLKKINLSNNDINDLGVHPLFGVKSLKELNIKRNQFGVLSTRIKNLKNLKKLNLSYNNLSKLPETIGDLKNLKTIDLSNNNLTCIPESLFKCRMLDTVLLCNNQISRISNKITRWNNITQLDLSKNNIEGSPSVLTLLKKLDVLDISENPLLLFETLKDFFRSDITIFN